MEQRKNVYKMFVNGKWVDARSNEKIEVLNPATGEAVAEIPRANSQDVHAAIEAAFYAKDTSKRLSAAERSTILEKVAHLMEQREKEFTERIVLEAGKPYEESESEVKAAILRIRFAAEEAKDIRGEAFRGDMVTGTAKKVGMMLRYPLGVIVGISPFNYPLNNPASKIGPAIAAGNTVVFKPSSDDPSPVILLAQCFEEAGLPAGILNVVTGGGQEVGDELVTNPRVNMVSFTGSTDVGRHIAEKAVFAKLHLELGGKCPALVFDDADLDLSVKEVGKGAFKYAGQRCDALSRILVVEGIYDAFVSKMVEEAKNWSLGDPMDLHIKMGPLIHEAGMQKVEALVQDAVNKGAILHVGGKKRSGLFYEPTVLSNVTTEMRIAWEETFGPIAAIMKMKDSAEALEIANRSEFGLDSAVFTQNVDRALDAALRLETGTVQINAAPSHGVGNFPFGGDEVSGLGREGIKVSVEEMTSTKSIIFNQR